MPHPASATRVFAGAEAPAYKKIQAMATTPPGTRNIGRIAVSNMTENPEAAMATTTRRMPVVTLGWQTWSVLVVVLTLLVAAAVYVSLG